MRIQYCSDLHLEFPENRRWLAANPLIPSAEILIIAGDCFYLGDDYQSYDFIRRMADEFEAVYILPATTSTTAGMMLLLPCKLLSSPSKRMFSSSIILPLRYKAYG